MRPAIGDRVSARLYHRPLRPKAAWTHDDAAGTVVAVTATTAKIKFDNQAETHGGTVLFRQITILAPRPAAGAERLKEDEQA